MGYTHEWYEKNKESLNKSSRDYYRRKRLDKIKEELSVIHYVRASAKYSGLPLEVEMYLDALLNKRFKRLTDSMKLLTI